MKDSLYLSKQPEWIARLQRDLEQILRTGFCGTCADCPGGHDVRPDLCVNRDRYDHRITPTATLEYALTWAKKESIRS